MAEAGLDLLLPRRCPLCGKISEGICGDCRKKIQYVRQPACCRCGKPLQNEEAEYCTSCRTRQFAYTQGRALCVYAGPVKESLYAVKYKNKREYLEYYAQEMSLRLGRYLEKWQPEVLVPVPMHISAKRKRGYNQAEILAKELGRQTGIPVRCDVLKKIKKTANQKELDYRARRSNLKGAFAVCRAPLPWKCVLLVDDVYTTGSTVNEAAAVLKEAGVEKVNFVTICIVPENS